MAELLPANNTLSFFVALQQIYARLKSPTIINKIFHEGISQNGAELVSRKEFKMAFIVLAVLFSGVFALWVLFNAAREFFGFLSETVVSGFLGLTESIKSNLSAKQSSI